MQVLIAFYIAIQSSYPQTGYLVVESTAFEITALKTQEMCLVDSIASAYHVNARELLKDNNYFEVRTDWNKLYVERKKVVKKNGKLKYKKWRF